MKMIPSLKTAHVAKLEPGELILVQYRKESYVALVVKDPHLQDKMVLLLGPPTQDIPKAPIVTEISPRTLAVSFAKKYHLRVPCAASAWSVTEPDEGQCLVLAEDTVYMRAQYGPSFRTFPCYINIKDGLVLTDSNNNYAHPDGDCTYTADWVFFTDEEEDPREILSSQRR